LRRIRYLNLETGRRLTFVTNHFELPAGTVAELYRRRWGIELWSSPRIVGAQRRV
jgi:IS4 transposase